MALTPGLNADERCGDDRDAFRICVASPPSLRRAETWSDSERCLESDDDGCGDGELESRN